MSKKEAIDQVNQLIEMGKEKGFLTYEEVNDRLPSDIVSPDQIDDLMIMFGEMDIEIVEGVQKVKLFKRKLQKTPEEAEGESEEEIDQVPFEKFNDPVRMYLREMGSVSQEKCVGCGTCEGLCPDIFQLNEETGKSSVIMQGGDPECIEEAIAACPAEAISWEEA